MADTTSLGGTMNNPEAIYNQACADIEKLALDHGITREQAAGLMIDALKPVAIPENK